MNDWTTICKTDDILPNSGRCALLGEQQLAIFRVQQDGKERFFAVDNLDPFSGANVLSRGIVGSLGDKLVVASPVYKQHFCLQTGACLEENINLRTWKVRVAGRQLQVSR